MLAIDISVYTGEVTEAQMRAVKDAGYELVIIGGWHGQSVNTHRYQQAVMVQEAGLLQAVYNIVAPPSWTPHSPTTQMLFYLPSAALFIAPDAELDITPDMLLEALTEAKKYGRTCIYTGAWWWNPFIDRYRVWFDAHPDAFDNEPCWLADYDGVPVLDTPRLAHLGPVVGKQFKGTTYEVGNMNADLSVFDPAFVLGEGEKDMFEQTDRDMLTTLINRAQRRFLVKMPNRDEVYELVEEESKLVHLVNPGVFSAGGGRFEDVVVYPPEHDIWKLRVTYPAGVPEPLKA